MSSFGRVTCRLFRSVQRRKSCRLMCGRRHILSEAYYCRDAWKARIQNPAVQKLDIGAFALRLHETFDKVGSVDPVDMDILANRLDDVEERQMDYVTQLFYRFRHIKECVNIRASTPHALIRAFLHHKQYSRLLDILSDKVNYGMFLDDYTANILLDHFIENHMYQEAARVAYDLMLQEDLGHPLCRLLAWYACHLRWTHPADTTPPATADHAANEDDEEVLVRVEYLERPWFDSHFDISKETQLLGKTLVMVADGSDDVLGRSYRLIGLGLYEQYEHGIDLLKQWTDSETQDVVCQEALNQFRRSLVDVETKKPPTETTELGALTIDDVTPCLSEETKTGFMENFEEIASRLISSGKVVREFNLGGVLLERLEGVLGAQEPRDIAAQRAVWARWEAEREALLERQTARYRQQLQTDSVSQRLNQLWHQQQKLRFFELENLVHEKAKKGKKKQSLEELFESEEFKNWSPRM